MFEITDLATKKPEFTPAVWVMLKVILAMGRAGGDLGKEGEDG